MSDIRGTGCAMLNPGADWHSSRHHRHIHSGTAMVSLRASRHASCSRGVFLFCRTEGT